MSRRHGAGLARLAFLPAAAALAHAALAEDAAPAAPAVREVPNGYAFTQPEILADQLVWGVAHGVRLLGRACAAARQREAAEAWINWQERELAQFRATHAALARHYFPDEADVSPEAIAMAIGLKPALDIPAEQLQPACDSLAAVLAQERYNLAYRRSEILKELNK